MAGKVFKNPVLFADYSDPDVIRVNDEYILTASSFNYVPGLPILSSNDLVNWELIAYAIDQISEDPNKGNPHEDSEAIGKRFEIPRHSEGVWAPAIRFHDGKFFIFYGMPDEGIYMVQADSPLGPWTAPVCVRQAKGFIDPCPYWDDDGRAYIIHAYARSRIGFKSILGIFEITPDGTKAISEDQFIFDGNDPAHPAITIEGPKVYKRNGYYYILAPAGGVTRGWQVALRSRDIHGPYEIKTVMEQGDTIINGPHQGGLVDSKDGREWFLHFQDRGLYGRICHLQPVTWKDDWPIIGNDADGDGCGNPVSEWDMPAEGYPETLPEASDWFVNHDPGLQWQWLGNLREDPYAEPKHSDGIALRALNLSEEDDPVIWHSSNVLTQKLVIPEFYMDVRMDASRLNEGNRAGILMMGGQYACLYAECTEHGARIVHAESEGDDADKTEIIKNSFELEAASLADITFRMVFVRPSKATVDPQGMVTVTKPDAEDLYFNSYDAEKPELRIFFKAGDAPYTDSMCRFTPSDHTWVGAKTGVFALAKNGAEEGAAEFLSVVTTEL